MRINKLLAHKSLLLGYLVDAVCDGNTLGQQLHVILYLLVCLNNDLRHELPCKGLATPAHVGSGYIKKVDVDAIGCDTIGFQQIRNVGCDSTIRFHSDSTDRVHACQSRGSVTATKNHVGFIGKGDGWS